MSDGVMMMAFWKQPPSPIETTITIAQARIARILFLPDITPAYHDTEYLGVSLSQYLTKSLLRLPSPNRLSD
jgi:hypothetical protein